MKLSKRLLALLLGLALVFSFATPALAEGEEMETSSLGGGEVFAIVFTIYICIGWALSFVVLPLLLISFPIWLPIVLIITWIIGLF